ncbi:MAG TPA: S-methyl-5-thioribose-1-phosphate isomerase [Pirellulales bacterium]|jgi:methylthioribose-1-phosphate isomerase|nr:S-methyl-5-thioribose-1-phosphate isomerase [Pirellulales bacterium]
MTTAASKTASRFATLRWLGGTDGHLRLIDQTRLPGELVEIDCYDVEAVWEAIRSLRVRGAPAIAMAAAYGVCLGLQQAASGDEATFFARFDEVASYLASSRPTAVNLFWALERLRRVAESGRRTTTRSDRSQDRLISLRERLGEGKAARGGDSPHPGPLPEGEGEAFSPAAILRELLDEAHAIVEEDRQVCRAIGRHGAELLADGQGVLTHCNAGGLATADYGTALAVFFTAHESGKRLHVYADETRPLLQGARLTAWELQQRGIDVTLICDSMAAKVMREGRVQAVVTGADRIAANGDTANKIGTYGVAILAAAHDIPFYIAAPLSTFDLSIASGEQIPIEQRSPEEITHGFGRRTAPEGIDVYNPAFDVTPAHLIRAIICERGLIQPVTRERIAQVVVG